MSASREKKQRQGAGPSEKDLRAQKEQAARRRTTIVYSVIAAVIAVLVIALLVWRSGFFQARASAATLGDGTLSTAELSYYYYDARRYTAQLAAYGMTTFDSSKADDEQMYNEAENKTYRDYFLEEALKSAQQDKALADEAVKLGHTEDEVQEQVDDYLSSLKSQATQSGYTYGSYLRLMYGPYMSNGVLNELCTRSLMAGLARNDKSKELFNSYSQSDLDAYYQEHKDELDTIEYSSLYFPIASVSEKDADGNDLPEDEVSKLKEEAKADAKKKAEEALEAVEGGAAFQAQIDKYELTSSSADHAKTVGTSTLSSSYKERLLKLDKDACELVETDSGYFVISFHDRYLDDTPTRDVRHILALAENTTDEDNKLVAPTDEAWAAAKEKIEAIKAEYDAGDKTEDAFAALANEKSDDGDGTTGGLYERITEDSNYVPEFLDWIYPADGAAHAHGDTDIVQHVASEGSTSGYYGYHFIYYVGENEPVWMGTVRSTKASEDQQSWLEGLTAGYPTALSNGAKYLGK